MKHFAGTKLFSIIALLFSHTVFAQQVVKPFAGGTGVSQANTKTLTLSGPNSFTGATVASGQTLTLTGATVAGAPTWSSNQAITLSTAAQTAITSVGALNGGSITSGFGSIDIGADSLTAGAISGTTGAFSSSNSTFGAAVGASTVASITMRTGTGQYAWSLGAQSQINNGFDITPSTVVGGVTFTTPVISVSLTGLAVTGALSATGAVTLPGLASSSAATTGTLCWTTGTGNVNVDTTTTCLLSSGKYKQNDRPLTSGLQQVMALRPVSYMLKPEFNPTGLGEQIGFFAEDVAKVDERLVSKEADGSPHAVRYMQMSAVIVKAIQEQESTIEALTKRVRRLETILEKRVASSNSVQ